MTERNDTKTKKTETKINTIFCFFLSALIRASFFSCSKTAAGQSRMNRTAGRSPDRRQPAAGGRN